jgi:hypothetical protein
LWKIKNVENCRKKPFVNNNDYQNNTITWAPNDFCSQKEENLCTALWGEKSPVENLFSSGFASRECGKR